MCTDKSKKWSLFASSFGGFFKVIIEVKLELFIICILGSEERRYLNAKIIKIRAGLGNFDKDRARGW